MAKTKKNDDVVSANRRLSSDRREPCERRHKVMAVESERRTEQRRKTPRRRQIDPTTCERDYSGDEIEFMQALDAYKRSSGRMFPTCSEILEVIRNMGYIRITTPAAIETNSTTSSEAESTDITTPAEVTTSES